MKTEVNGLSVYYEEYGPQDAPAVLVLPGWMAKASLYRIIPDTISSSYRVILLDLPGFKGDTPEPPAAWDLDGFIDFTIAFIQSMGLTSLTLVGHSFGGRIIIKMNSCADIADKDIQLFHLLNIIVQYNAAWKVYGLFHLLVYIRLSATKIWKSLN